MSHQKPVPQTFRAIDIIWTDDAHAVTTDGFSAILQRGRFSGKILITISNCQKCLFVVPVSNYDEAVATAEKELRLIHNRYANG